MSIPAGRGPRGLPLGLQIVGKYLDDGRALAVAAEVGGVALAIDAKGESAARWYERFGALPLLDDPLKLVLPLSVVADAIKTAAID